MEYTMGQWQGLLEDWKAIYNENVSFQTVMRVGGKLSSNLHSSWLAGEDCTVRPLCPLNQQHRLDATLSTECEGRRSARAPQSTPEIWCWTRLEPNSDTFQGHQERQRRWIVEHRTLNRTWTTWLWMGPEWEKAAKEIWCKPASWE